jgi:uncharacterized protein YjbI with pentapeptide repeats
LDRVDFVDCRLSGLQLIGARLRNVRFVRCQLDACSARSLAGYRVEFDDCRIAGADFTRAGLPGAQFIDCDLTGADFSNADVAGARFHGSRLDGVRGVASLRGATVDLAQVVTLAVAMATALGITVDADAASD